MTWFATLPGIFGILSAACLLAIAVTASVLSYARRHLLDRVTERSSHRIPTPRGGGLGVVMAIMLLWPALVVSGAYGHGIVVWIAAIAILSLAGIGWWDDHGGLPARWRLLGQGVCATAVVIVYGSPVSIEVFGLHLGWPQWISTGLAVIGAVWLVNLTNFMDGIDGLAGAQGAVGCLGIWLLLPYDPLVSPLLLITAGGCFGFLFFNWPPAKIFLGDVGSTVLGFVFAIGILSALRAGIPLEAAVLPVGPFFADATMTLLRRAWRQERLGEAHRSHCYQRLSRAWGSHRPVTLLFTALAVGGTYSATLIIDGYVPSWAVVGAWFVIWSGVVAWTHRKCPA
jgi:Fuc2NAc and GlcNAc transferase